MGPEKNILVRLFSKCKTTIKMNFVMTSLILLTLTLNGIMALPVDLLNKHKPFVEIELQRKNIQKRSPNPLEVGLVTFGTFPKQDLHSSHHVFEDHDVITRSTASVYNVISHEQPNTIKAFHVQQKGPSIDHNAVPSALHPNLLEKNLKTSKPPLIVLIPDLHTAPTHIITEKIPLVNLELPHAVSNVRKTSITTKLGHTFDENDHAFVPIITQSVSHHQHGIVHSDEKVETRSEHEKSLHDTPIALARSSDNEDDSRFREHIGGFGSGLNYGGQGAGHGFYAFI